MPDPRTLKVITQIVFTAAILIVSCVLIFIEPNNSDKLKWAFGMVGLILGYWIK